jgi:hypothetical protein
VKNGSADVPLNNAAAGKYQVEIPALAQSNGKLMRLSFPAQTITLTKSQPEQTAPQIPMIPAKSEIHDVNQTISGIKVLRAAQEYTAASNDGIQPNLLPFAANADAAKLTLSAGTTRKTENFEGAAFAGFEMEGVKQVKVLLKNTYYNAFSLRGKGVHTPMYKKSKRSFAGIMVNYHTAKGYTKKVAFGVGVMADDCNTLYPSYAGKRAPDQLVNLGDMIDQGPESTFALDLTRYAPPDWDGRLWLSGGSDWVAADRRLTVQLVAFNEKAGSTFLEGTNDAQLEKLYRQPRQVTIPLVTTPPMIDGIPDEEIWRAAAPIAPFFQLGGKAKPSQDTQVIAYYDQSNVYLQFICQENKRVRPITGGSGIWRDDEVEIWLNTNGDGKSFRQIIINAAGEKLELNQDGPAKTGADVAAHIDSGRWVVEAAIPFKGLGVAPKPGDKWHINICRHRPADGNTPEELNTWAPLEKGFNEPQNFGVLQFGK